MDPVVEVLLRTQLSVIVRTIDLKPLELVDLVANFGSAADCLLAESGAVILRSLLSSFQNQ